MEKAVTIGEYLLTEIKNLGIDKVFGIPGDMIIKFFKLLEEDPEITLCTFSHEPAVGFAAIGAARGTRKPAVACITYGPGGLNMLNAVACAYAEKTPLVVISGGPALSARTKEFFFHHTVKSCESQLNVYREVTQEAVILDDPETAAHEIKNAFAACQEYQRPVYIELPADMVNEKIIIPPENLTPQKNIDQNKLKQAATEVLQKIFIAEKPVIMAGVEAIRFDLMDSILVLAKKLNLPVVSTMLSRDFSSDEEPYFFGTYLGKAGNFAAAKLVEESDLILLLGEHLSDVNLGAKLTKTKTPKIIQCFSQEIQSSDQTYKDIPLKNLLNELCKEKMEKKNFVFPEKPPLYINRTCKYTPAAIATSEVIDAVNWFFGEHGEMPLIADTGNCLFMTLQIKASSIVGASFYGTMGFAVPAAIGYAVSTKKRPLVLIGDGAFQMTGQEICHCPKFAINPIFIVVNNRLWGMEQLFHPSKFNELVNWSYAKMAELWGGKGYLCDSCEKFYKALEDAKNQKTFTLIEVVTEKDELSEGLLAWIKEQKEN